jgi:hypothetical protein
MVAWSWFACAETPVPAIPAPVPVVESPDPPIDPPGTAAPTPRRAIVRHPARATATEPDPGWVVCYLPGQYDAWVQYEEHPPAHCDEILPGA